MEIKKIIFSRQPHTTGMELMSKWLQDRLELSVDNMQSQSYNSRDGAVPTWRIKNAPKELLGVYFQGGERDPLEETHTLNKLKKLGGGATKMFVFMLKPKKKRKIANNIMDTTVPLNKTSKAQLVKKKKNRKKLKPVNGLSLFGW